MTPEIGSPQDRYALVQSLGVGATGRAFLARRASTGERVVVKLLDIDARPSAEALELATREAKVLGALDHPALPRLIERFDRAEAAGPAVVVSYVEGETVRACLERGPASPARIGALLTQGLELLEYLHTRVPPVIHRDLSPQNVLIAPDGGLRVVDFSGAQTAVGDGTGIGPEVVGTHGYMAPEQLLGHADARSDLYGLGMTFMALALGKDVLSWRVGRGGVPRPGWQRRRLPPALRATLAAMTAARPDARPASASAARALLATPPAPRRGAQVAGALGLMLVLAWVVAQVPARGQRATLGGWFTGHGGALPAIAATLTAHPRWAGAPAAPTRLAWSPGGGRLASVTNDGELIVWEVPGGRTLWRLEDAALARTTALRVSDDGHVELLARGHVVTAADGRLADVQPLTGPTEAEGVALSQGAWAWRDQQGALAVGVGGESARLPADQAERLCQPALGDGLAWLDASGTPWLLGGAGSVRRLPVSSGGGACAVAGAAVWVTRFDGVVRYDTRSGALTVLDDFASQATVVAASPDGQRAAWSPTYAQGTVNLGGTGGVTRAAATHRGAVTALAFSPDGAWLATAAEDQTIRLWDVGALEHPPAAVVP